MSVGGQPGKRGAPVGHVKAGGRAKGTLNHVTVEIRELARVHGPAVIARLVTLTNDPSGAVAVAASRELLDRGYGKPPQSVAVGGDPNAPRSKLSRLLFIPAFLLSSMKKCDINHAQRSGGGV